MVAQLYGVIKGAAESDKQKRLFQKLLGVAVILIIALVGAMLGVSIAAGEAIKESHVNAAGQATTLGGSPLTVSVTTELGTLYDLPALGIHEMSNVEGIKFFVTMPSGTEQMAVRPSSMHTGDNNVATVMTPEGHVLTIRRAEQTASIVMGVGPHAGTTLPVTADAPASARKLVEVAENRRMARRGSFLSTSGSFALSSGGAYGHNAAGN